MNTKFKEDNNYQSYLFDVISIYDNFFSNTSLKNDIENEYEIVFSEKDNLVLRQNTLSQRIFLISKHDSIYKIKERAGILLEKKILENTDSIDIKLLNEQLKTIIYIDLKKEEIMQVDLNRDFRALINSDKFYLQYNKENHCLEYANMQINNRSMHYYFKISENIYDISSKSVGLKLNVDEEKCTLDKEIMLDSLKLKIKYDVKNNYYFFYQDKNEGLNQILLTLKINKKIDVLKIKELCEVIELNFDIKTSDKKIELFINHITEILNKAEKIKNVPKIILQNLNLLNTFNKEIKEDDTLEDITDKISKNTDLVYIEKILNKKEPKNVRKAI